MLSDSQKWFKDYKSGLSCESCGETRSDALEFHHVDPKEKKSSIANLVHRSVPIPVIKAEIAKCICLCASCHKVVHANYNFRGITDVAMSRKIQLELLRSLGR